jgi:hypothetical protein
MDDEIAVAYAEGLRAGFDHGFEVGYGRAHHEMATEWHRVYLRVQEIAKMPTNAELMARRGETYKEGVRRAA